MTKADIVFDEEKKQYLCIGNWSVLNVHTITNTIALQSLPHIQSLTLNGKKLEHLDSAGALALTQFINELERHHNTVFLEGFSTQHKDMLNVIKDNKKALDYKAAKPKPHGLIYNIGKLTIEKIYQIIGFIILVGDLSDKIYRACRQWRRFRFTSIVANIQTTGLQALPIVGLLSFLIGIVLAYQMGLQLETYGANVFIAYLSGMAVFREFSPLITAIIVAGRTSSAFTAQIGSMKINEEIDALYTMGLSPTELLVAPKVLGLLLVFPLLIFWADFFGVLGAMLASKSMLGLGYQEFLTRLQDDVGLKQLMLGLYKAPAFAILIALVGCFQGFRVEANADSVGFQTTKSVVQALFLIIITDAVYSIIYSWKGL